MKTIKQQFLTPSEIEALDIFKSVSGFVLAALVAAGAITISLAMPGLAGMIGGQIRKSERAKMRWVFIRERFDPLRRVDKKSLAKARQTLYYLRRNGYVSFDSSSGDTVVDITDKGRKHLNRLKLTHQKLDKPAKWDGSWWVVLADIPTRSHRVAAELFRQKLKALDFYPLQRTVWVSPYNPAAVINGLTEYYDLGRFVTLMQVINADADDLQKLKKYFNP